MLSQYLLYFVIFPIGLGLACFIAVLPIILAARKFPKFKKWLDRLEPNQDTKVTITMVLVVVLFYWAVNYK